MKRTILILLSTLSISFLHSQDVAVDSKGEPVFQFYSKEDVRLQFTRRAPLAASYVFGTKVSHDNHGILVQLSALNSGDFSLVERLRDVRPGAGLKLGYQNTIAGFPGTETAKAAWGINAIFNVDNIKLYDTAKRVEGKRYPLTYGAEGNYTIFFGNKTANWQKALSFYAAITSTWNDRNLLSYQEISQVTTRPDVVAMKEFEGRYGVLRNNFFKYRMAISLPMFYKHFNPTPYLVAIFGTQNSPSYHMGVFSNVLAYSLKNSNKMPSTFGLGFDWVYATEHLSSKVNFFVKAAISLDKLKE
ncbi:MAG: hypothetical protein ACXVBX_15735 [Flavisolibacter sp.]